MADTGECTMHIQCRFQKDPSKIEALITPRTVAIAPTQVMGSVCRMDAIVEVAREHGLKVVEEKTEDAAPFANLITVSFEEDGKDRILSGTIMRGEPFIVRIDQYWMDIVMEGYQLLAFHRDRPGLIGEVGQVTGRHDINIAFMGLGRLEPRGDALMALTLDEPASPEVQAEIEALKDIYKVRLLEL